MAKQVSAGLLMYRIRRGRLEVFLVHHGGPFFRRKDRGAWFVPKGTLEAGEAPLEAAVREFTEETGIKPSGQFVPLGSVRYKSGKRVHAWAFRGDIEEPFSIKTLTVELEWPPRSGKMISFPEIDRAEFFGLIEAKQKAHPAHADFIERLERYLKGRGRVSSNSERDEAGSSPHPGASQRAVRPETARA